MFHHLPNRLCQWLCSQQLQVHTTFTRMFHPLRYLIFQKVSGIVRNPLRCPFHLSHTPIDTPHSRLRVKALFQLHHLPTQDRPASSFTLITCILHPNNTGRELASYNVFIFSLVLYPSSAHIFTSQFTSSYIRIHHCVHTICIPSSLQ